MKEGCGLARNDVAPPLRNCFLYMHTKETSLLRACITDPSGIIFFLLTYKLRNLCTKDNPVVLSVLSYWMQSTQCQACQFTLFGSMMHTFPPITHSHAKSVLFTHFSSKKYPASMPFSHTVSAILRGTFSPYLPCHVG